MGGNTIDHSTYWQSVASNEPTVKHSMGENNVDHASYWQSVASNEPIKSTQKHASAYEALI
jgi:hypothetical protein